MKSITSICQYINKSYDHIGKIPAIGIIKSLLQRINRSTLEASHPNQLLQYSSTIHKIGFHNDPRLQPLSEILYHKFNSLDPQTLNNICFHLSYTGASNNPLLHRYINNLTNYLDEDEQNRIQIMYMCSLLNNITLYLETIPFLMRTVINSIPNTSNLHILTHILLTFNNIYYRKLRLDLDEDSGLLQLKKNLENEVLRYLDHHIQFYERHQRVNAPLFIWNRFLLASYSLDFSQKHLESTLLSRENLIHKKLHHFFNTLQIPYLSLMTPSADIFLLSRKNDVRHRSNAISLQIRDYFSHSFSPLDVLQEMKEFERQFLLPMFQRFVEESSPIDVLDTANSLQTLTHHQESFWDLTQEKKGSLTRTLLRDNKAKWISTQKTIHSYLIEHSGVFPLENQKRIAVCLGEKQLSLPIGTKYHRNVITEGKKKGEDGNMEKVVLTNPDLLSIDTETVLNMESKSYNVDLLKFEAEECTKRMYMKHGYVKQKKGEMYVVKIKKYDPIFNSVQVKLLHPYDTK